jgi:predicted kinase
MARLVLINGAPGAGKSSVAHALAQDTPMMLALDIDAIKHALGSWEEDPVASGLHARRLSLGLVDEQLRTGFDVVMGQYLAQTQFIEELEGLAVRRKALFCEFVLDLDAAALRERLEQRARHPDRSEHEINNRLVGQADAEALLRTIEPLRRSRPRACWVDAAGPLPTTVALVRHALHESRS